MTTTPRLDTPAARDPEAATPYEVRVAGHLDDHWSAALSVDSLDRHDDATTTLTVAVADQAQLHGVLVRIRDLGVELLSLSRATDAQDPDTEPVSLTAPLLAQPLHTARLTLRPATAGDVEPTWRYRRLDSVNEWLTGGPDSLAGYRTMFSEPARLATTVVVERTGTSPDDDAELIGDFMLRREDAWSQAEVAERARGAQAELGWVLDPAHTGAGYAKEAVRELLRYCFEDLGVHRVVASCFLDNEASWRLMERVGMRRETHAVRESLHRSGRWLDSVAYAVVDDEWRTMSATRRNPSTSFPT